MRSSRAGRRLRCAAALALLALAGSALAKAPTVALSISGGGLALPLHTTDPAAVAPNVWTVGYVAPDGEPVPAPAADAPRYRCFFWARGREGAELKFTVLFVPGADGGRVYVPDRRDPFHRNNAYTILLGEHEGRWFRAAPAWGTAVAAVIAAAPRNAGGDQYSPL